MCRDPCRDHKDEGCYRWSWDTNFPGLQWHSSVTFHWWTGLSLTPVRHSQKLGDPLDTSCKGGGGEGGGSSVKNRIESNLKVAPQKYAEELNIKKHKSGQDGLDQNHDNETESNEKEH